jgi:hypothetical protein
VIDVARGHVVYQDKKQGNVLGVILFNDITGVMLVEKKKNAPRFDILIGKLKVYELEAPSLEDAREWVAALTIIVATAEARSPTKAAAAAASSATWGTRDSLTSMEGHLKKMSPKKVLGQAVWQNRLFRLNPARKTFAYFTEDSSKALSIVPIDLLESVVPHARSDRRFTVVLQYTPPRLIHLLAPTAEEARRWVARLTALASTNGQTPRAGPGSAIKAKQWKVGEGAIARVGSSEQMHMTGREKLVPMHLSEGELARQVDVLKEGAWFKRYVYNCLDDASTSTKVFVFVNRKESCLYWTEEGCAGGHKNKDKKQCITLKSVSDLLAGCR